MPRGKGRTGAAWRTLARQVRREEQDCWLCGRPIDPRAPARTRWSFSVDHVIPISKGGHPLDRRNARAAHYGCNSSKGNRLTGAGTAPLTTSQAW